MGSCSGPSSPGRGRPPDAHVDREDPVCITSREAGPGRGDEEGEGMGAWGSLRPPQHPGPGASSPSAVRVPGSYPGTGVSAGLDLSYPHQRPAGAASPPRTPPVLLTQRGALRAKLGARG